jgi:sulfonate transport system ATP-binding protein
MTRRLEISGLTKAFGMTPPVLGPVSLSLEGEGITAIIGRSGSGKSTFLRCLSGLEIPTRGTALLGGKPIRPAEVGFVFQEPRLMPWLSVRRNIAFGLGHLSKVELDQAVDEAMAVVGLSAAADYLPKQLSGGMAQRAALARALAPRPELLLLDEPLSALDPLTRDRMQEHILYVAQHIRATILLITHDMDEALALANRVIVLRGPPGRIVLDITVPADDPAYAFPRDRTSATFQTLRRRLIDALEQRAAA